MLKARGVTLIAASAPMHFIEDTPTAVLVRQVLGAVAEFEKTTLVAKLAAARRRKRIATGKKVEGRKSHAEKRPRSCAGEGARAQEAQGREAEPAGYRGGDGSTGILNERGKPFNPKSAQSCWPANEGHSRSGGVATVAGKPEDDECDCQRGRGRRGSAGKRPGQTNARGDTRRRRRGNTSLRLSPVSPPSQTRELLDEPQQMCVDDLFGGVDFLELPVVGRPAHPFRFRDVVSNSAVRSELAPQLESTPQSPIMGGSRWQA